MKVFLNIFIAVGLVATIWIAVRITGGSYCDRHPGAKITIGDAFLTAECRP